MSLVIRAFRIGDDAALEAYCAVTNAVTPESPASPEECRWADATYPGMVRWLADLDGRSVGTAAVGRIYMYPPEFERFWFSVHVLPRARRAGIGSSLYQHASDVAREAGKTGFQTDVSERQEDGLAFLAHRGFEEYERSKAVRLELGGRTPPDTAPPHGIRLTTLAARPDLVREVYEVASEALPDIPHQGDPIAVGPFDEFVRRDLERPGIDHDALILAIDEATGIVVGYGALMLLPGNPKVAYHYITAVRRGWRGRGIAGAMKRATMGWAIEHGLEALETGNDVDNAPMRAVNARLGYRPLPDIVSVRGPLAPFHAP